MAKCMEFYFPCEASEMLTEVPKKIKKSVFMHAYSITEKTFLITEMVWTLKKPHLDLKSSQDVYVIYSVAKSVV